MTGLSRSIIGGNLTGLFMQSYFGTYGSYLSSYYGNTETGEIEIDFTLSF